MTSRVRGRLVVARLLQQVAGKAGSTSEGNAVERDSGRDEVVQADTHGGIELRWQVDDLRIVGEVGWELRPAADELGQDMMGVGLAMEVVDGNDLAFEPSR